MQSLSKHGCCVGITRLRLVNPEGEASNQKALAPSSRGPFFVSVRLSCAQTSGYEKSPEIQGFLVCGERGIRTPGGLTLNGFQDRRIRPLCHLSIIGRAKQGCKNSNLCRLCKIFIETFRSIVGFFRNYTPKTIK
jgi:hypothetical protein